MLSSNLFLRGRVKFPIGRDLWLSSVVADESFNTMRADKVRILSRP